MQKSYSNLLLLCVLAVVIAYVASTTDTFKISDISKAKNSQANKSPSAALVETVRFCSQNLQRFGQKKKKEIQKHQKQKEFLITRMVRARCSVVALQEIYLNKQGSGEEPMKELVASLQARTGRSFSYYIGKSRDKYIANGFIVAQDIGEIKHIESYSNKSLPKIKSYSPPRYFSRGPVMLELKLNQGLVEKLHLPSTVIIYTMHFKSKHSGWKDPAKTMFEISRMEMAAGLRELAFAKARSLTEDSLILLMGDRNNHIGSASVEVMTGELQLEDFDRGAGCIVDKDLAPQCSGVATRAQQLVPLFEYRREHDPRWKAGGSHKYRGKEQLLDEIFVRPADINWVQRPGGQLSIGFEGQFFKGSDHKLIWVELQTVK